MPAGTQWRKDPLKSTEIYHLDRLIFRDLPEVSLLCSSPKVTSLLAYLLFTVSQ